MTEVDISFIFKLVRYPQNKMKLLLLYPSLGSDKLGHKLVTIRGYVTIHSNIHL